MLSNETYNLQGLVNAGKMAGACDFLKSRTGNEPGTPSHQIGRRCATLAASHEQRRRFDLGRVPRQIGVAYRGTGGGVTGGRRAHEHIAPTRHVGWTLAPKGTRKPSFENGITYGAEPLCLDRRDSRVLKPLVEVRYTINCVLWFNNFEHLQTA